MPALRLRFSFLRGWASTWPMHQHTQTAAGDLPDSVRLQSAALHFATANEQLHCLAALLHSVPQPESGGDKPGGISHRSRSAYRLDADQLDSATALKSNALRSAGWHERNGQVLRCSFLRACELGLASFLSHKSHYVHSRPSTGTRSRRTPGAWVPAVSRLPANPSDGPIE